MNITHLSKQFQQGDHNSDVLLIQVGKEFVGYVVSLKFKTPLGFTLYSQPIPLDADGNAQYSLPAEVLDGVGCLQTQIVISNSIGNKLINSEIFVFNIFNSLDGEVLSDADKVYSVGDILQKIDSIPTLPEPSETEAGYVLTVNEDGTRYILKEKQKSVLYVAQSLTEEQQTQARTNIGATSEDDIADAVEGLASEQYVTTAVGNLDNSLSSVAKSGSYDDLSDTPEIPSIEGLASETYVDSAVAVKQDSITDSNKLDADLVDDSDSVKKFVTAADKANWNGKQNAYTVQTVTLAANGWTDNEQTVTAAGVTATNLVQVASIPDDVEAYASSKIICTEQSTDSLTFVCDTEPEDDLTVNVVIWG